jgi:hypothetical protein
MQRRGGVLEDGSPRMHHDNLLQRGFSLSTVLTNLAIANNFTGPGLLVKNCRNQNDRQTPTSAAQGKVHECIYTIV